MAPRRREPRLQALGKKKVGKVMDRSPRTVTPDTPLPLLIGQILEGREFLAVVDEKKRLVGVVSESDIFQLFMPRAEGPVVGKPEASWFSSFSLTGEIMNKRPVTVRPEMSLLESLNLMIHHKFRHLPVTKKGKLVGVLSLRDILRELR